MSASALKRPNPIFHCITVVCVAAAGWDSACAISFEDDVQPIFRSHCTECHGAEQQKSGLRLDAASFVARGGDSGEPIFLAGNSQESHLIQLITEAEPGERMPPKGLLLSASEVETLTRWIDEGAVLPEGSADAAQRLETDHWSFQPVTRPAPPGTGHPIDAFISAKLDEMGLEMSAQADRHTLIRRLYLVTHGLPPTPEQVAAFVADDDPEAYAKLVAEVLESPRYGERWARHWLDVVRYADTNGFETNRERKTAYHYRDYVIRSFNEDKPYDQFLREQLAGDSLGADIATGFLVAGPYDIVKSPDINLTLMQRQDELADMVNTTGTAFLGLTLGCARCHHHKFDPILQKDYYAMQAVFAGVQYGERALPARTDEASQTRLAHLEAENRRVTQTLEELRERAAARHSSRQAPPLREAVHPQRNEERFPARKLKYVRFTIHATNGSAPCLDEWEIYGDTRDDNVALEAVPTASGSLQGYPIHKLEHINDGQTGNAHSWISDTDGRGWVQLELPSPRRLSQMRWSRDRQGQFKDRLPTDYVIEGSLDGETWETLASSQDREPFKGNTSANTFIRHLPEPEALKARALLAEAARLQQEISTLRNGPQAWIANFSQPPLTHRLYRGEPTQKREVVAPDALTITGSLGMKVDEPEPQRRLKLAQWITRKENPLTARVMANRLWHYIFGRGLAETPSDLGVNGIPPSHPMLLDWLASEFMDSGWSIKHLQRLILTSHTFQQSSRPSTEALEKDADARFLWRYPRRRLEAEAIRDSILSVSGALNLTEGGPGFYLHHVEVENVMHYFPKDTFGPPEFRRMVYLFKIRQEQDAIFGAFDCPDGNQVIPKRSRSNTPLQALNLFNSPFVLQQAKILAERLTAEGHATAESQTKRAFLLCFARSPDEHELAMSQTFIAKEGLHAFCRALFNSSELLFVF